MMHTPTNKEEAADYNNTTFLARLLTIMSVLPLPISLPEHLEQRNQGYYWCVLGRHSVCLTSQKLILEWRSRIIHIMSWEWTGWWILLVHLRAHPKPHASLILMPTCLALPSTAYLQYTDHEIYWNPSLHLLCGFGVHGEFSPLPWIFPISLPWIFP